MANSTLKASLLKYEDVAFNGEAVNQKGMGGYYGNSKILTIPSGYKPVSALWIGDFVTGVYPVLNRYNRLALNSINSIDNVGNDATVRVYYMPLNISG